MLEYEDMCVGCPSGLPCLGSTCPNRNVAVYYCDKCNDYAEYHIDGEDLCESCAKQMLQDMYENPDDYFDLSIMEMAEDLDIYATYIN